MTGDYLTGDQMCWKAEGVQIESLPVGVAGLVPVRRGPKGASKLTPELAERITGLDAAGATLREIAAATGVSTFSVRNALGRVASGGQHAARLRQLRRFAGPVRAPSRMRAAPRNWLRPPSGGGWRRS